MCSLTLRPRTVASAPFHLLEGQGAILKVVAEPRKILEFLASGGEEFNPGPETRLDCSELLCNKVLLKHKEDRESS